MNLRAVLWYSLPDLLFAFITNAYRILNPKRKKILQIPLMHGWLFLLGNIKLLSPSLRNTAIVECLDYRVYERYFEIEKGDVLIDVGAGIGEFTILAGVKVGSEGVCLSYRA